MALICGTLLSSQGSGAHQYLPFLADFGATFLTYPDVPRRSNPPHGRIFPRLPLSGSLWDRPNLASAGRRETGPRSRRLGVRSSHAGPQDYVPTWSKSKSMTCEADHLAVMVTTTLPMDLFPGSIFPGQVGVPGAAMAVAMRSSAPEHAFSNSPSMRWVFTPTP